MRSRHVSGKGQRGFTLIELVVVLVVIGFLAAIAVPRFVDLTNQAKDASERGTVGGVRAGIALQYADSNPKAFQVTLDSATAGADCGPLAANQCFGNVTEPVTDGGADGWRKCTGGTIYRGPNATCYQYTAATGRFSSVICPGVC